MTRREWRARFCGPERLAKCGKSMPGPAGPVGRKKWPGFQVQRRFRTPWTGTCGWVAQLRAHLRLVTMSIRRLSPSEKRAARVLVVTLITGFTRLKTGAASSILAAA